MRSAPWLLAILSQSSSCSPQDPIAPLDAAAFTRLHRDTVPAAVEAWQTIPWRVDLDAARREATTSGRPLFLWTMNGHPLGCT